MSALETAPQRPTPPAPPTTAAPAPPPGDDGRRRFRRIWVTIWVLYGVWTLLLLGGGVR